jgi:hypothetical protein
MEKTGSGQELSSVSGLFISSQEEKKTPLSKVSQLAGTARGHSKDDFEIEEFVTVRKRIAYPGTQNGQETMKKNLFGFLQDGYSISRIELKKTSETLRPGNRTITNEEIALYLKLASLTDRGEP